MAQNPNKSFEFLCTLRESTSQLICSALQAYNHSIESCNWEDLDSDQQSMVKGWHIELQQAHKQMNPGDI